MRLFLLINIIFFLSGCSPAALLQETVDQNGTAIIAVRDFIELDKIARISKFRSGYGHDFSYGTGESCRSMKHYFDVKKGIDPRTVRYFSPVNGMLKDIQTQTNEHGIIESRFSIHADENQSVVFRFFHVALASHITNGAKVSAGEYIGTIGHPQAHGEIAVEDRGRQSDGLLSWFDVIGNELSYDYAERGVNKEKVIIKKELRDARLLHCDPNTPDGRFIPLPGQTLQQFQTWQMGEENWVVLNGTSNQ